ncbi:MAG: hypothetical protein LBJ15_19695 [Comamonas sp.]|uniref:hypothetical protein n=1 Tax=Comamonas sp. TaxID=34028 RepID=UPI0028177A32|nr:hypothetical protein [Comamonas sp.]MDR0216200.1 hypothetical protein [Comamonas sp.]
MSMHQEKEQAVPVCWRIKTSGIEWLREKAREQDRTVTWVINKLVEQAKNAEEAQHASAA